MSNHSENHAKKIKSTIENIIGANATLKRRRKTEEDFNREQFEKLIRTLEEIEVRSTLLEEEFELGFFKYEEKFYSAIDSLLFLYLGKDALEVVDFYLFGRFNPDGSENHITDESGNIIPLRNPTDLWNVIQYMKSNLPKNE
jgi:hypothetical protein